MSPDLTATRAITVRASAGQVWPWIAQLGQGRGGFYSYDFLENLVGCDIHSADRVVPGWQDIKIGDKVKLAPAVGLDVAALEAGRWLVLRGGVPIGDASPPYDFTWAWVLRDEPGGTSRLLVREIRIHQAVGPVHRRARRGGQLRDEPENAPRDQGPGQTGGVQEAQRLLGERVREMPRLRQRRHRQ